MRPRIISKSDLMTWLENLLDRFPIVAPVAHNGDFDFQQIESIEQISFDYDRTRLSLKSHYFLPEQQLWVASMTNGSPVYIEPEIQPKIIFGARPCDITALLLFDEVFSDGYNDPYYKNQRENNITIGLRCIDECRTSFCGTMQSYNPLKGYDLMLTELPNNKYVIEIGTLKGIDLLDEYPYLFKNVETDDKIIIKDIFQTIEDKFKSDTSLVGVRALMDLQIPEEMIKKYGDICLSCGQCSFVCPTCWCFNVNEKVGADNTDFGNLDKTERSRKWTSCLYREFHTVSGKPPHIFKKTVGSRIEAYYNHKLRGITEKFGVLGCVGCGRCLQSCPVGIDPKETILEITSGGKH